MAPHTLLPKVPAKFTANYETLGMGFAVQVKVELVSDGTAKAAGLGDIAGASGLKTVLDELTAVIENHLALLSLDKDEVNRGLAIAMGQESDLDPDDPPPPSPKTKVKRVRKKQEESVRRRIN